MRAAQASASGKIVSDKKLDKHKGLLQDQIAKDTKRVPEWVHYFIFVQ
jgi:hypothetical protein